MSEDGSYASANTDEDGEANTAAETADTGQATVGRAVTAVPAASATGTSGSSTTGEPTAGPSGLVPVGEKHPFTRSRGQAPPIPPTLSKADQAARKRGEAAAKLNTIRGLLETAAEVVDAVAQELAHGSLDPATLQHDLVELAKLYEEIEEFDVSGLANSWKASIRREITARLASLSTARVMLEARVSSAAATTAGQAAGTATSGVARHATPSGKGASSAKAAAPVAGRGGRRGGRQRSTSLTNAPPPAVAPPATGPRGRPLSPRQNRLFSMSMGGASEGPLRTRGGGTSTGAGQGTSRATPPARAGSAPPLGRFTVPPPPLGQVLPPAQPLPRPASLPTSLGQGDSGFPATLGQGKSGPRSAPFTAGVNLLPPNMGGGWSAPSWQQVPAQQFAPQADVMGDEYYLSFPYPWNSLPQSKDAKVGDILKIASQSLPKFDGDRRSYLTWRSSFIPSVHLTTIDLTYKVMLLRSSMLPSDTRMKEFINSIVDTPEGYRQAVLTLEERYGGSATLLLTRQEALMSLPELKEGDFRTIETLHVRLGTFLLEWEGIVGTPLSDRESLAYYMALLGKVEANYCRKYLEWAEQRSAVEGLRSFHEWLAGELKRHRRAEVYMQFRTGTLHRSGSRAGTDPPRGRVAELPRFHRPPLPPPSVLDRNFPRTKTFVVGESEPYGDGDAEVALEEPSETELLDSGAGTTLVVPPAKPAMAGVRPPCPLCQEDHGLGRCGKFRELPPADRKMLLIKEGRCFLCFQKGHNVARCRFTFSCRHCKGKHHTLIHGADVARDQVLFTLEEEEEDIEAATESLEFGLLVRAPLTVAAKQASPKVAPTRVSLRTLPVWVENPQTGKTVLTNAMLDDGCSSSALIGKGLAERLQLKGQVRWATTEGVGGHVHRAKTLFTCVRVLHASTKIGRTLPAQVMEKPAGAYEPVNWALAKKQFPHLCRLPLGEPVSGVGIELMIGNQCAMLTASLEEVMGEEGDPVGRRTLLGWTAVGPVPLVNVNPESSLVGTATAVPVPLVRAVEFAEHQLVVWPGEGTDCVLAATEPTDKQLVRLLERMLEVEDPGEAEMLSPKEEFIVKQARDSLTYVEGRYQVGCTWSPGGGRPPLLQGSAEHRLRVLEQGRYFKKREIREAYQAVITSWEQAGFIKPVQEEADIKHLIPHFPIVKESESTPVRPVMDCSTALNNFLLSGPNLLNEVNDVLLRFRSGLYSYSGDVKQMFLKIRLPPQDRPYHCFLWRPEPHLPSRVYQFQVHVFGNAGSPFLAVFVVREHAKKFLASFPSAADTLIHSTLIDDVLDSADSVEKARHTLGEIKKILAQAGMSLAKAHSNSTEVLRDLHPSEIAKGMRMMMPGEGADPTLANLKTLGLHYCPQKDQFVFALQLEPHTEEWTKRKVLKIFPQLFDPLGLLLPFSMVARMLFSTIAREVEGWDSPLPAEKVDKWQEWIRQLRELEGYSIPRCLKQAPPQEVQLHMFADASGEAYAAVAYLRCEYDSSPISVRLVSAKAHVAPRGRTSIPRLELLAAELSVKLREQVLRAIKVPVDSVVHWSDSMTVLYWINNDKRRLQLFVHNRVRRIQRGTEAKEWRWTPTEMNPADAPTRGNTATQLKTNYLWTEGPAFLQQGAAFWPASPKLIPTSDVLAEMKKGEQVLIAQEGSPHPSVFDWERFSSWNRIHRLLHRLLLWRECARRKLGLPPIPHLWRRAELLLVRQIQLPLAPMPGACLKAHWRRLGFVRLTPFLDPAGLWRGEGRLRHQEALPEDARAPLLLPKGHPAVALLLRHLHVRVLHHAGGTNYVLSRLNARFWLPHARAAAYKVLENCVPCKRQKGRAVRPPEGPLPEFRLPPQRGQFAAFGVTAVDCAGPFRVKRGRSYETYYLLLLTCCQVRAVRLEYLSDLSVDAFLLALTRASSRGVNPHTVLSDNGGNFEGANRLLRALWKALPQEELMERKPMINWRFNPPYASHYGGVFERLIKATKEALYHVLPAQLTLTLEELVTAFAVVEGILNARPLSYTSTDPADLVPLTPNHFLHGAGSVPLLLPGSSSTFAKRWSSLQRLTEAYLTRFHSEIRPHLQLLHRQHSGGRELRKGDVVTFLLPSSSKMWPLGRISQVFPGLDGHVRTVEVTVPPLDRNSGHAFRKFRRDVGSVALLLPAHQIALDK